MTISGAEKIRLDHAGFVVLEGMADPELVAALHRRIEQLFDEEGERAGAEFRLEPGCRRLANLVDKGEVFQRVLLLPWLSDYVAQILGPDYKLSSLNARSVNAGWAEPQPLHADMGALPDERGPWVANVVWMLDPFTRENGALRLIPGSHRFGALPAEKLADPAAAHPDQIVVTGKRGTIVVYNAHLWHGGLANRTSRPRTALHAFFLPPRQAAAAISEKSAPT